MRKGIILIALIASLGFYAYAVEPADSLALSHVLTGTVSKGLEGRISGLYIIQNTGRPDEVADVYIRGVRTTGASARPLVIVDGAESELDLLDADEIQSIELLKDGSSAALYGIRGNNGVLVITTKHGMLSAPQVRVNAQFGVGSATRLPKMANSAEWIGYYNDLCTQEGVATPFPESVTQLYLNGGDPDRYPSVDWVNEIYGKVATIQKYGVSVTGGSEKVHYYVKGSYYNENGIFKAAKNLSYDPQTRYGRFNFHSNVDVNITKSLLLNLSLGTQYRSARGQVDSYQALYANTLTATPIATPVKFSDGKFAMPRYYDGVNPYNTLNAEGYRQIAAVTAQTRLKLTQDFSDILTSGLKAGFLFSLDTRNGNIIYRHRNPRYYYMDENGEFHSQNDGSNYMTMTKSIDGYTTLSIEPFVSFDRAFGDRHEINAIVLANLRNKTDNVPASYIEAYAYRFLTFAGSVKYSYDDKYWAGAALSYSGSDNFDAAHRFGIYPSVEAGANLGLCTVRASFGLSGSEQLGSAARRFAYNSTLDTAAGSAVFGETGRNERDGIATACFGQEGLAMEQSRKVEIDACFHLPFGIETGIALYSDVRSGIFIEDRATSSIAGKGTQYVNLGGVDNKGLELSAQYARTFDNGFELLAYGNISYNHSKITADGLPKQLESYQQTIGGSIGQQYGLVALGLFQSEDEIANSPKQKFGDVNVGDVKYMDQNGDNVIDAYDIVAIGHSNIPAIVYGFGADLKWKSFDLALHFNGNARVTRIISGSPVVGGSSNQLATGSIYEDIALNRWTPSNTDAKYPRMYLAGSANNSQASTMWQRNMSFLRLGSIEAGYTIGKFRICASAINPFTISSFKLWDPALDCNYGDAYPIMKMYVLGVNIKF